MPWSPRVFLRGLPFARYSSWARSLQPLGSGRYETSADLISIRVVEVQSAMYYVRRDDHTGTEVAGLGHKVCAG